MLITAAGQRYWANNDGPPAPVLRWGPRGEKTGRLLLSPRNVDIIPPMRTFIFYLTLTVALMFAAACGSSEQPKTSAGNAGAAPPAGSRAPAQTSNGAAEGPPVATSHGAPPAAQSSGADTAALDAKIEQAEARAKAAGATAADKKAAAAAYLERANVFYTAGSPSLYKFALRDFRRTLKYDPANEEAQARKQQIEEIYRSMGRPVPDLGNEP